MNIPQALLEPFGYIGMPELVDNQLVAFRTLTRIDEELVMFWKFYRDEDASDRHNMVALRRVALTHGATSVDVSMRPSHWGGNPTAIVLYKVDGERSVTRL